MSEHTFQEFPKWVKVGKQEAVLVADKDAEDALLPAVESEDALDHTAADNGGDEAKTEVAAKPVAATRGRKPKAK